MTREDYEAHKEDYKDHNVSAGAFVLIQDIYIAKLEADIKTEELAITILKDNLKIKSELVEAKDKKIEILTELLKDTKK